MQFNVLPVLCVNTLLAVNKINKHRQKPKNFELQLNYTELLSDTNFNRQLAHTESFMVFGYASQLFMITAGLISFIH